MKSLNPSRCALSVCGAAALLAGCGSPSSPSYQLPSESGATWTQHRSDSGGKFSARFSGSYTFEAGITCNTEFDFGGSGKASFFGSSGEHGSALGCPNRGYHGEATISSNAHSSNTIRVSLAGDSYHRMTFKITRGTGKFAHAAGSGTVRFATKPRKCHGGVPPEQQCGHYTDGWTGTIHY